MEVSVALCTYNGARFIEQQLHSILAQTRPVDEIVLSDDGSGDDTVAIARGVLAAAPAPPRFILLRSEKPGGVTANFERACVASTGELIALSDQDDVWAPGKIATMVEQFELRDDLAMLFTDARLVDGDGADLGHQLFEALEVRTADLAALRDGHALATLLRRNLVTGATAVFRRSLLDVAVPFDPNWLHDEWLAVLAAASSRIDWMPHTLIDYRQHGSNQVGVAVPTLRYKLGRLVEKRGDRTVRLADRTRALLQRMRQAGLPGTELVEGKLRLESARAALPADRIRRLIPILRAARGGSYARFASRGRADMLRDLLQSSA